jgi:hypothetical protein
MGVGVNEARQQGDVAELDDVCALRHGDALSHRSNFPTLDEDGYAPRDDLVVRPVEEPGGAQHNRPGRLGSARSRGEEQKQRKELLGTRHGIRPPGGEMSAAP